MEQKFQSFLEHWKFDRGLTLDLLKALSAEELWFSPGDAVGPLWKQFRHIGRVQENYVDALSTRAVKFTAEGSYTGTADGGALVEYLERLDAELRATLEKTDAGLRVDWFGQEQLPVFEHLLRMLSHETLHHGQLMVYCKLRGVRFPESWQIWGV